MMYPHTWTSGPTAGSIGQEEVMGHGGEDGCNVSVCSNSVEVSLGVMRSLTEHS